MNLAANAPLWLVILLAAILVAAAAEDAARLRISNLTCLAVLSTALLAMLTHGFDMSLWQNWAGFAIILALGTAAFAGGLLGGGDVKLLAALALWFDLFGTAWLIGATFVAGGLVAAFFILSRTVRKKKSANWKSSQIPYGLAIAAGALFVLGTQAGQRFQAPGAPVLATPT